MDYAQLKTYILHAFNQIRSLIPNAHIIIRRQIITNTNQNYYITGSLDTNITSNFIDATFECIYTTSRFLLIEQQMNLGVKNKLRVYVRYDDILNSHLQEIKETDKIIFQNKAYDIDNIANVYNILYMLELK